MALRLAEELGGEILSVDSVQVYRGMDVGSAKPSVGDRARVPHHLVDLADPEEPFTVAEFQEEGRRVLRELAGAVAPAVIAGGSGLHFRALVDPLRFPPTDPGLREELEAADPERLREELVEIDPAAGRHVQLSNPRRVVRAVEVYRLTGRTPSERALDPEARAVRDYRAEIPFRAVGLDAGELLEGRIERRLDRMLGEGLLDEVARLAGRLGPTAGQAVGYKELLPVVEGALPLEEGRRAVIEATLELARQQRTYFGRDPRIRWVPWSSDPERRYRSVREALSEEQAWSS